MRVAVIVAVVVGALVLAAPSLAVVKKVSFTSKVRAGSYASLTVRVKPAARCRIEVEYDTVISKAKGLNPKKGAKIAWRWRVGTSTHPGRWPVRVDCGKSGKLNLRLRVLPR